MSFKVYHKPTGREIDECKCLLDGKGNLYFMFEDGAGNERLSEVYKWESHFGIEYSS